MFRKPRPVEGFLLRDAQGKEVTHRTLAGDKTLLLFAYPKCETRCPVTLAQAKEIAKHVRVLVVCADPDETPEGITAWAERTGLQCVRGETMELMHSFRQYGTGAADHPADFFLLDEQVRWVGHWPHPADTAAVIEAVK